MSATTRRPVLAMRKAFLRAPVEFTRVSSAFNPHRQHPILKYHSRPHGHRLCRATGTPVHAAGGWARQFCGPPRPDMETPWVLTHGGNVSTLYGHMSRFARNIHVGTHVQQGDVIGYVGMTGLATGPHLHYEYLTNGVHRNPQTVQLPGAEPLRAEALQRFRDAAAPLIAGLSQQSQAVASQAQAQAAASQPPPVPQQPPGAPTSAAAAGTPSGTAVGGATAMGTSPQPAAPVAGGPADPRSKAALN